MVLQPLSSEAFRQNKDDAEKYRELNEAYQFFAVNEGDAMELIQPQFELLVANNPELAQWLNGMVNRNNYWNGSLIYHAEQWYRLSQHHQEFVQALADMANTNFMLVIFHVTEIEELLTNFPLTARVMLDLIRGQSRLALELFHNIHAIAHCASQAGDAFMQQHLQALTVRHALISGLLDKLGELQCCTLMASLTQHYIHQIAPGSYYLSLTEALQHLADKYPELLQAINAQGNNKQAITALFKELALRPQDAQVAAQLALNFQVAATPCPYCLEVFFMVLGIGDVLSQTK